MQLSCFPLWGQYIGEENYGFNIYFTGRLNQQWKATIALLTVSRTNQLCIKLYSEPQIHRHLQGSVRIWKSLFRHCAKLLCQKGMAYYIYNCSGLCCGFLFYLLIKEIPTRGISKLFLSSICCSKAQTGRGSFNMSRHKISPLRAKYKIKRANNRITLLPNISEH